MKPEIMELEKELTWPVSIYVENDGIAIFYANDCRVPIPENNGPTDVTEMSLMNPMHIRK